MRSISYDRCITAGHTRVRHSPNGVDIIEECFESFKAWQIFGVTDEIVRLPDSWMIRVAKINHD